MTLPCTAGSALLTSRFGDGLPPVGKRRCHHGKGHP